jgi:hypothetical protein
VFKIAVVMIWNPIYLVLCGIAISLYLFTAYQYFNVGKKIPNINERLISYSYSIIFIFLSISLTFIVLAELQIQGVFFNNTFYGDLRKGNEVYQLFIRLQQISTYFEYFFFFYVFGRYKKREGYLLMAFNAIGIVLTILLPFDLMILFNAIYQTLVFLIFLSVLLIYTKWSQPELKATTSFIFLGSVIIMIGSVFNYPSIKEYNILPLIYPAIFYILGTLLCLIPVMINPK